MALLAKLRKVEIGKLTSSGAINWPIELEQKMDYCHLRNEDRYFSGPNLADGEEEFELLFDQRFLHSVFELD